jgi:hypothetical protein
VNAVACGMPIPVRSLAIILTLKIIHLLYDWLYPFSLALPLIGLGKIITVDRIGHKPLACDDIDIYTWKHYSAWWLSTSLWTMTGSLLPPPTRMVSDFSTHKITKLATLTYCAAEPNLTLRPQYEGADDLDPTSMPINVFGPPGSPTLVVTEHTTMSPPPMWVIHWKLSMALDKGIATEVSFVLGVVD